MKNNLNIFIIMFFSASSLFIIAMDQPTQLKSSEIKTIEAPRLIACLKNSKVAVAGKNGCVIFDQKTRTPIYTITQEEVFDIAVNKDKSVLALSINFKNPIIYHIKTKKKDDSPCFNDCHIYISFSSIDNTLFLRNQSQFLTYNFENQQIKEYLTAGILGTLGKISCHPTKKEIIQTEEFKKLYVTQIDCSSTIQPYLTTTFKCDAVEYAPEGNIILILNKERDQQNYFICNLDDSQNPLPAHQLIADNKDYVANAFHPTHSIIALLTNDNSIHLFDYKTLMLIAKTKKLAFNKKIGDVFQTQRLDFNEDENVFAALMNTWIEVEIPKNNFYTIWQALYKSHQIFPRELVQHILVNIIQLYEQTYDSFDLEALLSISPIKLATYEAHKKNEPTESERTTRQIVAKRKRNVSEKPTYFDNIITGGTWHMQAPYW